MARKQPNRETASVPAEPAVPLETRIRERAYAIWAENGYPEGSDVENWLQAEHEVLLENAPQIMGAISTAA